MNDEFIAARRKLRCFTPSKKPTKKHSVAALAAAWRCDKALLAKLIVELAKEKGYTQ